MMLHAGKNKNSTCNSNDEFNSGSNLMTYQTDISNHFNNCEVISISFLHVK